MRKQIAGVLLLGLLIAFGCSREPMPIANSAPVDLNASIAQAKTRNKLVLLDFTGSDWCPPCKQLHREIFSQPEFQAYAGSNLVFVTLDFPRGFHLSPEATATNNLLATEFNIEGFPTLIALDGDGKELWRQVGYFEGGLKKLDAQLASAKSGAK